MKMLKKITGITLHKTSMGDQMSVSYGLISDDGIAIAQNKRAEFILNSKESELIQEIYELADSKIEV